MKRGLITLSRVIRSGCINFVRNITLSVAATAVMTVTLTTVLFSVIANTTLSHTIDDINKKIDISVYLKDSVTDIQKDKFINELKALPNVKDIQYVSKKQALRNYREQNKDDVDLLLAIAQTNNPLPATIIIKPVDPIKINDIKAVIETPANLQLQSDATSYSGDKKEAIDNITKATQFFRKAVFAGVVLFAVISMMIIFNTIQMAIFNRREELTIMRLLGAKPWFIRGPFIVETVLYGIVSAVISLSVVNFIFAVQSQALDASSLGLLDIQFANDYFAQHFWLFLSTQLLAGITIGAVSALIATKRYLKTHVTEKRRFRALK